MSITSRQTPELLAPAGSLEAFFAALDAGADAVYVGLKAFSARAKARNFSLSDIEKMSWLLKGQGKHLYVTLNTLVKEAELPELIDTLASLERIGVSAVIIQDLAIWKLAKDHFPDLELHASTQMTIHNTAGVKMLERMGFTRGVLARELTLDEIAHIRRQTTLELEHFIHGALCFSFSGQCYFSSFLSGKSGNRGRCAQPCRRNHKHRNSEGYYFSPNDLSAIDLLPELEKTGICSLKIEGRMKSAEYVNKVVGAYRRVLDAGQGARKEVLKEAKLLLKESFGRQPTKGFLAGAQPSDMAIPTQKGATGRFLGELSRVRGAEIGFKSKEGLHIGDRLRIQPVSDKSGTAFTIRELMLGKNKVGHSKAQQFVTLKTPFYNQFKVGDGVFMVSSKSAFSMSDNACRRQLEQARPAAEKVDLDLTVSSSRIDITAAIGSATKDFSFAIESHPAEHRPLAKEILEQAFSITAKEPFVLNRLTCGPLPAIVIPPKQLKQIRRDLYAALRTLRQPLKRQIMEQHKAQAIASLCSDRQGRGQRRTVSVLLRDTKDQQILQNQGVDVILVPLTRANLQHASKLRRKQEQITWDIPFVLFDRDWDETRNAVRELIRIGFHSFRLNNLGHFLLFDKPEELTLKSSFRLFSLNSQAICAHAELGIKEAELYIEDDRSNLTALLNRQLPIPTGLTIYASVPLLTSRVKIKQVRADSPVLSDQGNVYRVQQRQGLTWLNSEQDFSFIGNLTELEQLGCHNFVVDLSHLGPFTPRGKMVLEALQRGVDPPDISKFNFESDLE